MKSKVRKKRLSAFGMAQMRKLCYDRLLSDLNRPEIKAGIQIDGERTLSERYDVPLSVVRSTLGELKKDGVIESIPRVGMCLVKDPPERKTLKGKKFAFVAYMDKTKPEHVFNNCFLICSDMEDLLHREGGDLHFFNIWDAAEGIPGIARKIKEGNFNALAYVPDTKIGRNSSHILANIGIPMVAVDEKNPYSHNILFDDEQIGQTVASHILDLGHQDVAVLYYPELDWSVARVEAIKREFARRGSRAPDIYEFNYFPRHSDLRDFVKAKGRSYSAVIAANDLMAGILLTYTEEFGIRVPEDLSVIGVDDYLLFRHLNLTTVQLSSKALGRTAFDLLKEDCLNPDPNRKPQVIKLKCPLMQRTTTRRL